MVHSFPRKNQPWNICQLCRNDLQSSTIWSLGHRCDFGDRSSAAIPEVESRPETEVALGVENLAEVEITVPIIDERDLVAARPETAEKLVSQLFL